MNKSRKARNRYQTDTLPCPAAELAVRAYLTDLENREQTLPAMPGYPKRPWYGEIERLAGTYRLFLAKPAGRNARHAVDTAARRLGLAVVRPQLDREIVTVTAAGGAWCAAIREEQEALGEYSGPQLADARRLIALLERRTRDIAVADAHVAVAALQQAIAAGQIRNASDYARTLPRLDAFLRTQTSRPSLPATFHGALERAMAASGLSAGELARRIGILPTQIVRWRSGERVPDVHRDHLVAAIERELSLDQGELQQRIERRRAGRGRVPKGFFPPRLRKSEAAKRRGEIARRLTDDVMAMNVAARHAEMEALDRKIDAEKAERVARNALRRDRYALKTWPAAVETEFAAYAAFKGDLIPAEGLNRNRRRNRATTLVIRRQQFALYFGFLCDRAGEGHRVEVADLSLLLLVVPSRLDAYMRWKTKRVADDKPNLTPTDHDVLTVAASLLNPIDGYLVQRPDLAPRMTALLARYELKMRRRGDGYWTQVSPEAWHQFCEDAFQDIKRLENTMRKAVIHRKRFQRLLPALELPDPLHVVYRAIDSMRQDLQELDRDSLAYARAQRALLLFHLSTQMPLRVETWAILSVVGPDPDLAFDGCWRLKIPTWKMKTGDVANRFRDDPVYRRILRDDDGLYGDIEEYLRHSRPMLLGDGQCDLLLVNNATRPAFSKGYLSNVVRERVRRYISREAQNQNALLGLDDFALHPFRHILATAILKRTGSYELAADTLGDDPETVRAYYGVWRASDREEELLQAVGRRTQ